MTAQDHLDVANTLGILSIITASIFLFVFIRELFNEKKRGHEYHALSFVGIHHALPPAVFGQKETISEKVIVKLEAGTPGHSTIKFEIDFYDYDLDRWSTFGSTDVHAFKVTKWAPMPKAK